MVLDNTTLKQAISKVRDELQEGYHEVTWLNQAKKATEQRQSGALESYLKQHAEELFGDLEAEDGDQAQSEEEEDDDDVMTSDGEWSAEGPTKIPKPRRGHQQASKAGADITMEDVLSEN